MTPEIPDRPDEELSPEDEELVRRLLVSAHDRVSLPDDVAGRLDDVLAGLRAERGAAGTTGATNGDELSRAREARTRRWPRLLVAAAAVSVIGVGVGNVVQGTGGDSQESVTTSDAGAGDGALEQSPEDGVRGGVEDGAEDGSAGPEAAPAPNTLVDEAPAHDRSGAAASTPQGSGAQYGYARTADLQRIRTASATRDAQRIHDLALAETPTDLAGGEKDARTRSPACDLPDVSRGERLVAVRLDGERATLLFGARQEGHRQAEVFACDDGASPVLEVTVDAP